jgi:DNA repair exonuclease SbcCD ATPase subunit
MATWKEQYLAALQARDAVEQANLDLYDYCTRLADGKADLEKKARLAEKAPVSDETPEPVASGWGIRRVTSPTTGADSPNSSATQLAQLRQDLAKAQAERADLQIRLDSAVQNLDTLKAKSKTDAKRITQLNATVAQLTTKLRDRDEELRGKAKLIENVQDENVTLNLQLNMAEERSAKLKKENQELVDRWMARMGQEADRMNEEGKFG